MQELTLREIAAVAGGQLDRGGELRVGAVSTDTRRIAPGCLYLALKGERFDGHDFIPAAVKAGAAAIVSSRPVEAQVPVIRVTDTRLALGRIAAWYRERFSLLAVGVTGSVGKTSTKEMVAQVLARRYRVHKNEGNLNNDIGLPMTLLSLSPGDTAAVIEMGMSARGEIGYLSRLVRPDLGVITNVGVSHLEKLGTRENILRAKLEILDGMGPDGRLLLNADNDLLQTVQDAVRRRAVWFGIENRGGLVFADSIRENGGETAFDFVFDGKRYPAVLPLVGIHNVYNALAAFAAGVLCGVSPEEVVEAVRDYRNAGLRQSVREAGGVRVIADCYNASPDSMRSALEVIAKTACTGRRAAVLGDMLELGPRSAAMHRQVGKLAAGLDALVCYGPQAAQIAQGAAEQGMKTVFHTEDPEEAAAWLRDYLRPGDAVIFKASRGMKLEEVMERTFEEAGGLEG